MTPLEFVRVPRQRIYPVLFLTSLLLLWGCDTNEVEEPTGPVDLTQPWVVVPTAEAHVHQAGMDEAVLKASAIARFNSLLVVHKGELVLEAYFHGNHADILHDVRSVTKSIVSTLVGLAVEAGHITSLDDTIDQYLPNELELRDPYYSTITIRHLLTMTSGLDWFERGGPSYNDWIRADNHLSYLLDLPQSDPVGATFNYNSGAVYLLGVVLQRAVGMPLTQFADQHLFNPIGIYLRDWEELPGDVVNGGAGIDLRPRDLARIGQLFLQDGMSGEERILPAGWVEEATSPKFAWRDTFGSLGAFTYGYLWWVEEGQPEPAYYAWGYGGQFIYVAPDLEAVVVATMRWRGVSAEGGPIPLEQSVLNIIIDDVLPAIRHPNPNQNGF